MARKGGAPPPSTPLQSSSGEEEEEEEAVVPPQGPQPPPSRAAAGEDSGSDQDAGAQASQMRSPGSKPAADEEEDGGSAAPANKAETAAPIKKGPAPDPAKSKKAAKAEVGKVAPGAAPIGKGKKKTKAHAEQEKVGPEATPIGKGKKKKTKANAEQEKGTPGPAASGNANKSSVKLGGSGRSPPPRPWSDRDSMLILKTLAEHVKAEGSQMKSHSLLEAIGERLDRKDCTVAEMSHKVQSLARRYNSIAADPAKMPSEGPALRMYNLSVAIWGQEALLPVASAASPKDSSVTKRNKGQANKKNVSGNSKGGTVKVVPILNIGTQKGSNRDNAAEVETDRNVKTKLSKRGAATLNADALVIEKGERTNREASTGNENGGTEAEKENHGDDAEIEASIQGAPKSFDEMQNLYPQLAGYVESLEPPHPCKETVKMALGFIGDEKAKALESEMEELRKRQADTLILRWEVQKLVSDLLLPYCG